MLYQVKQLNHFLLNNIVTFYSLTHIALVCDCFPYWIASVRCLLLTFAHLNLTPYNPSYLSAMLPEHTLTDHP